MHRSLIKIILSGAFVLILILTVTAGVGYAQGGCSEAEPPSIGVAVGRSSPYFDFAREIVREAPPASTVVRDGYQVSVRGDASLGGPVKVRVEGSTAHWNVVRQTYTGQITESTPAGHMNARQLGAAIGLRLGRAPVCAHVLVGGGLYSLTFRGATIRQPGVSLTAGIEVPTGEHGRIQADVQVNVINTNDRYPVGSSQALAGTLMLGWAYRF